MGRYAMFLARVAHPLNFGYPLQYNLNDINVSASPKSRLLNRSHNSVTEELETFRNLCKYHPRKVNILAIYMYRLRDSTTSI